MDNLKLRIQVQNTTQFTLSQKRWLLVHVWRAALEERWEAPNVPLTTFKFINKRRASELTPYVWVTLGGKKSNFQAWPSPQAT